jgi:hypothetical protein
MANPDIEDDEPGCPAPVMTYTHQAGPLPTDKAKASTPSAYQSMTRSGATATAASTPYTGLTMIPDLSCS